MEEHSNKKRSRDNSDELELDVSDVKRIKEDLLGVLDETDAEPAIQDLDSVMKSFEVEISASTCSPAPVIDLTCESGESQPDLGYLLEASDDELGLPPSSINSSSEGVKNEETELVRVDSADSSAGMVELWAFEDQIPSYDAFGLGVLENHNNEYVAFDDGLFDHSNVCYGSLELSDYSWRQGSTPAE